MISHFTAKVTTTLLFFFLWEVSQVGIFATPAIGYFLKDSIRFGDTDDSIDISKRQGFAVKDENLEPREINLTQIRINASLVSDGVELENLTAFLQAEGVNESSSNVSLHETRMAVGKAMLTFLERKFGKKVIHLGDTSRVSGGAIYGEATVRDTSSKKLRNAHHVFHMDKYWPGLALMLNGSTEEAIAATAYAQWPFMEEDLVKRGILHKDYVRLASAQSPGMLNFWVSLTPGKLLQQPLALLMQNTSTGRNFVSQASKADEVVSSMHVYIKAFNDSITLLRSNVAEAPALRWGYRPDMTFGEALLFPTDRTPHSAVWLQDGPKDSRRVSAEIRVLVTDEPLVKGKSIADQSVQAEIYEPSAKQCDKEPARQANTESLLQRSSSVGTRHGD